MPRKSKLTRKLIDKLASHVANGHTVKDAAALSGFPSGLFINGWNRPLWIRQVSPFILFLQSGWRRQNLNLLMCIWDVLLKLPNQILNSVSGFWNARPLKSLVGRRLSTQARLNMSRRKRLQPKPVKSFTLETQNGQPPSNRTDPP